MFPGLSAATMGQHGGVEPALRSRGAIPDRMESLVQIAMSVIEKLGKVCATRYLTGINVDGLITG